MDFKVATDQIVECCRLSDVAKALDVSLSLVNKARMDIEDPHYRTPPLGWRHGLAQLARRRAKELERLATDLEGGEEGAR